MSPENFIYWLNGFVEMGGERPTDEQWLIIKEHLVLAMSKKNNAKYISKSATTIF